jgi:hypothetical protein
LADHQSPISDLNKLNAMKRGEAREIRVDDEDEARELRMRVNERKFGMERCVYDCVKCFDGAYGRGTNYLSSSMRSVYVGEAKAAFNNEKPFFSPRSSTSVTCCQYTDDFSFLACFLGSF